MKVYTREKYPNDWVRIQNGMASCYRNLSTGDRSENIEMAIQLCLKAIEAFTSDAPAEIKRQRV